MAGVVSVELVTITLANGTETVTTNLSKGQDEAKCAPFSSSQRVLVAATGDSDQMQYNHADIEIIDNAGTAAVRCSVDAMAASNSIQISVYVVEFGADITVVQGTFDIVASATTDVISITAVDETKAFLIFDLSTTPADLDGADESATRGAFSTSSELTFTRGLGPAASTVSGTYYIIEDTASNWDVQSGTHNTTTTGSSTITSIDTAKTFIIASYSQTHTVDDIALHPTVTLGSATTVTSARLTNTGTCSIEWFAVTFDSGGAENVYRGSIAGTAATGSASHTAIDPLFASVHTPVRHISGRADSGGTASSDFNQALVRYVLNGTDNGVSMSRSVAQGGSQSVQSWWETVEWEEASAGGATPVLTALAGTSTFTAVAISIGVTATTAALAGTSTFPAVTAIGEISGTAVATVLAVTGTFSSVTATGGTGSNATTTTLLVAATFDPVVTIGDTNANLTTLPITSIFDPVSATSLNAFLRPISDTSAVGWESAPTAAQPLWQQVDEIAADDVDYIYAKDPNP